MNQNDSIEKSQKKVLRNFWIIAATVFVACVGTTIAFAICTVESDYNNYVSIPNLLLTFIGCGSAAFFSLATFLNLNFSKEKKKERAIIANYSLINFCKEVTILEEVIVDKKTYTTVCFLVTESIKSPIHKVFFKNIIVGNSYFNLENADGQYNEDTLDRNYNSVVVNIPLGIEETKKIFNPDAVIKIELDIVSIFKVLSNVHYEIVIDKKKAQSDRTNKNPDKKRYPKLTTYLLHHSIYMLENQEIYE
jgi:hypothetical protein